MKKVLTGFALLAGLAILLTAVWGGMIQPAQASSTTLTATVNDDRSVTLTLSNGPTNWWFKVRDGGCVAASGTTADGGRGYDPKFTPHPVRAYSDSDCSSQIAETSFTIPSSTLTATVNNDKSVDLTITNPPGNWWFKIERGSCAAASGTGVNGISGYGPGTYKVRTFTEDTCVVRLYAVAKFTIPTDNLTAELNDDWSIDLTLSGRSNGWWFRINSWGSCTAVTGDTVGGIKGYKPGTYGVLAYSDGDCDYQVGATTFTVPTPTLAAVVDADWAVDLTLTNGPPAGWWFRINNGSCTPVSGNDLNNIRGYKSGTHNVNAYSNSGCNYRIGATSFTVPIASLSSTVHSDKKVDLTLSDGPSNWWFRIDNGSCTAVSGTTVSGISGYKAGTYSVRAFPNNWCGGEIASTTFTIP